MKDVGLWFCKEETKFKSLKSGTIYRRNEGESLMNPPDINSELHIAYREPKNWLLQAFNIMYTVLWFFCVWIAITTIKIGFISILLLLNITHTDIVGSTYEDFQLLLQVIYIFVGAVSAILIIIFGLPQKTRNIFIERAESRVDSYYNIRHEMSVQVDVTENLLLKHGLITEQDIDSRKADLEKNHIL